MHRHKILITISVMSATVMQVLDTTIVNVALPDMQGSFSANPDEISWVLTSYLVSSAIFMPLTGFFADRLGRKSYLILSIIGFTIASMLCGMSTNITEIVIFRLLQGIFGASLVPLSQAIMADTYPLHERGKAMAIWGMGVMIGPILGPTLGGYLTEYFNWRWNFYINLPVGIISATLAWYFIDETDKVPRTLDWKGLGLLAMGIGALQFTLDRGNQEDWLESNMICVAAFLSFVGLVGFIYYSIYVTKNSIFNLEIFKDRNFCAASTIMAFLGLGLFGAMVIQPIMLSSLFDYPALTIGLIMAPRGIASLFTMFIVGRTIHIFSHRSFILVGITLSMLGNYAATNYNLQMDLFWIIWPIVLQGLGIGLIFIPLSTQCLSTLAQHHINDAAGLFSLMRTIGFSAGISIVVTYFTRQGQVGWNQLGGYLNPYNPNLHAYLQPLHLHHNDMLGAQVLARELARQAQMQAVVNVFYLITVVFLLMIPLVFLLDNKRPVNLTDLAVEV
jgi:DHA2 family multidrug resistance protein